MNRVPDMRLPKHSYFDYAYLFDSDNDADHHNKQRFVHNAVSSVKYVMSNLEQANKQVQEMRKEMINETYDVRIQQVLDECGFGE
jgi:hypothetical protein